MNDFTPKNQIEEAAAALIQAREEEVDQYRIAEEAKARREKAEEHMTGLLARGTYYGPHQGAGGIVAAGRAWWIDGRNLRDMEIDGRPE